MVTAAALALVAIVWKAGRCVLFSLAMDKVVSPLNELR